VSVARSIDNRPSRSAPSTTERKRSSGRSDSASTAAPLRLTASRSHSGDSTSPPSSSSRNCCHVG